MIEARVFVAEIDSVREMLEAWGADFRGFYRIHDTIFQNVVTGAPLSQEFLRLRHVSENIWDEKAVILSVKKTITQRIGKTSGIPMKRQFDTLEGARVYYEKNLASIYTEDYSFWRDGWQYYLSNGDIVDLEVIENDYPSIEFKSETGEGVQKLLDKFGVSADQVMIGPSAVAIRELLKIPRSIPPSPVGRDNLK